jgi:hypothetical protein
MDDRIRPQPPNGLSQSHGTGSSNDSRVRMRWAE